MNLCHISITTRLFIGSMASVLVTSIPFTILILYEIFENHSSTLQKSLLLGFATLSISAFLGFIVSRFISNSILQSIQCLERNINHVIDGECLEKPCTPEFEDLFVKLTLLKEIYEQSNIEKGEISSLLQALNENSRRNNHLLNKLATDGQDDRHHKRKHGRFSSS